MHDLNAFMLEDGSRYYQCGKCHALAHVAPSAPDAFVPGHPDGVTCKGKFREVTLDEFTNADAKAREAVSPAVEYEPAPDPEPVAEPDLEHVEALGDDEPVLDPPLPDEPVEQAPAMVTYADETVEGDEVVDSNADVQPDVSLFVFQPPEPVEPEPVVEDDDAQGDEVSDDDGDA